jgi:hypothetical protein
MRLLPAFVLLKMLRLLPTLRLLARHLSLLRVPLP